MRDGTTRVPLGMPPLPTQRVLGDRDSSQLITLSHIMTRHPTWMYTLRKYLLNSRTCADKKTFQKVLKNGNKIALQCMCQSTLTFHCDAQKIVTQVEPKTGIHNPCAFLLPYQNCLQTPAMKGKNKRFSSRAKNVLLE